MKNNFEAIKEGDNNAKEFKRNDDIEPKVCSLKRSAKNEVYGFDLRKVKHLEKHMVENIEKNSPADLAGLKDGDFILEINNEVVTGMKTSDLIKKISKNPLKVDLLVVKDIIGYLKFKQNMDKFGQASLSFDKNGLSQIHSLISRIVFFKLSSNNKSLGFTLSKKDTGPHEIIQIEKNSASDVAGLMEHDLLLKIDNIDLMGKDYNQTLELIKKISKNGSFQLEVIQANLCPNEVKNISFCANSLDEHHSHSKLSIKE